MGWKAVAERYGVLGRQLVQVRELTELWIGSPYVPDQLIVDMAAGQVVKAREGMMSPDVACVARRMRSEGQEVMRLFAAEDQFGETRPVYTYGDGEVEELQTEHEVGWPNNTTCGLLMYDNMFFATRREALEAGVRSARGGLISIEGDREQLRKQLAEVDLTIMHLRRNIEKYEEGVAMCD